MSSMSKDMLVWLISLRKTAGCRTFCTRKCGIATTYRACSEERIHAQTVTAKLTVLYTTSGARTGVWTQIRVQRVVNPITF